MPKTRLQLTWYNKYSETEDFVPREDNLLILGESGDVLETLTHVPKLAVGTITNMYEIVEIMEQATSILRP